MRLTGCAFVVVGELVVGCIAVSLNCRDKNYHRCRECSEYYSFDDMTSVGDSDYVCQDCLSKHYCLCEHCEKYYPDDVIEDGLCPDCRNKQ